ncbi:MAG: NADH:flavin oxidoreductase/NADH oxidase [Kiloniellales bacterium]|nr:NADH:flavin oxidoreductase/NADH oxidase [Kiloniellales bacterium]MDJ0972776.1 NADH:flavin oxidoreductase/NADH oxidase [Kiloniellales bacterium]
MSQLFSPIRLRDLELPNRIVVSPMCQYVAEEGCMHDWHLMHLGQFAMGAAGLVFTEATHVSAVGRITPRCAGLWNDDQEAALRRVLDFCRTWGVAKLGVQLAHAGRKASCHTPADGSRPLSAEEGAWPTLGPSALPYAPDWHLPQALDRAGMTAIRDEFVGATERCRRLEVDVLELHAGHGYLLNQFFSPLSNRREDDYGGSLEKRLRYPLEVFEAVRQAWPAEKPLGVRISAVDWVEDGTTIQDTIAFARALEDLGCDFVDITSGALDHRQKIEVGPGYQVGFAAAVRRAVSIPVMAVGMINRARQAEAIIAEGQADFVMLARGMMYDPRWAWHAAQELGAETAYAEQYVRCMPARWPQAFAD